MTVEQISKLVASGESEALEFKATTGARREAAKTLCAMLNQQGGRVLFGVDPRGQVLGQQVSERTIEQLSAAVKEISPPTFPTIERIALTDDKDIVMVEVSPGRAKPYQVRGTAYRRVGNTTLSMSSDEHNRFLFERMHSDQRWENQPASGWTAEDLDVTEIRRTVSEAVRRGRLTDPGTSDPVDLLRGLGLYKDGVLLRAAVVLFGNDRRVEMEMPQCRVRVARFKGTDRLEFLDNRQFYGNAFTLLQAAERFLRETLPIAGRFEEGRLDRIDQPLYPTLAVREALANALSHRDYALGGGSVGVAVYDDRLEVTSSGTLHFGLTPEMLFLPHESLPWNPLISRTFYRRGLIEEWGRGTLMMAEAVVSAGLPHPEIEDTAGCVTVRFRNMSGSGPGQRPGLQPIAPQEAEDLNARQQSILAALDREARPLALREIHDIAKHVDERRLRGDLAELQAKGIVTVTGRGRGARWKRV